MADKTAIEWADSTFNPWEGCQKVSPACDHCYAEARNKRFGGGTAPNWGPRAPRRRTSPANWRKPITWQRQAKAFHQAHGRKRRVFCASLADVFDNQVPPEWRDDLWDLILKTPDLIWMLLTKRPQNIEAMKPDFWDEIKDHVWLGATCEDQKRANENIPHLLKHDAAALFVSAEPLLGPVDISAYCSQVDWIIAGSESGPNARPCNVDWVRTLKNQCVAADTAFFWKQNLVGGLKISTPELDGEKWVEFPR